MLDPLLATPQATFGDALSPLGACYQVLPQVWVKLDPVPITHGECWP